MRLLPTTLAAQIYLNIVPFHLLPLPFFFPFFKQRRRGAQRERGNKVAAADTQRCQAPLIETSRSLPDKQREKEKRGGRSGSQRTVETPGVSLCSFAHSLAALCLRVCICVRVGERFSRPLPPGRQCSSRPAPCLSSVSCSAAVASLLRLSFILPECNFLTRAVSFLSRRHLLL